MTPTKPKPIYEITLPASCDTHEAESIRYRMSTSMPGYHTVVIIGDGSKYRTRIIYPTPSFWGFIHNIFF